MPIKPVPSTELRLGPTSYLVLGLIGLRGESTPYQLKQAVARSIQYFWPFPHSQLYGEPERLAGAGLLAHAQEDTGRRRKTYTLTADGEATLQAWLRTPPDDIFEMRDMAVLQLFFSEFISADELAHLARDQVRQYQERLAVYQAIVHGNENRAVSARRMAPLDLGMRLAKVFIEFWSEIAENPPTAPRIVDEGGGR